MSGRTPRRRSGFGTKPGWVAALGALAALAAAAQEPAPDAPEEVVVRGRRLEEIEADLRIHIHDFLEAVAAPARGRGYARWRRELCVGVHNLETSAAQYIVDRISALALEVGLEPGEPGCAPQVTIVFSTDAQQTAALMVEREPRLFRPAGGFAGTDLGRDALDDFVRAEAPVRWWHVSLPVDARTGAPAMELPGRKSCGSAHCPPTVTVAGPSRIHEGTVDVLQHAVIVVDATRLRGTTWQQLGDYLAVVSLAQIDPRADPAAFDTILNLFTNPAAYSGLTDWDRSYLLALYAFDQERVPSAQRNEIASRIARRAVGRDE